MVLDMKERLNSYQDVYVAACGEIFTSYALGRDHEKSCPSCQAEITEEWVRSEFPSEEWIDEL